MVIKYEREKVLEKFYQVSHYMNLITCREDGLILEIRAPLICTE